MARDASPSLRASPHNVIEQHDPGMNASPPRQKWCFRAKVPPEIPSVLTATLFGPPFRPLPRPSFDRSFWPKKAISRAAHRAVHARHAARRFVQDWRILLGFFAAIQTAYRGQNKIRPGPKGVGPNAEMTRVFHRPRRSREPGNPPQNQRPRFRAAPRPSTRYPLARPSL